MCVFGGFFFSFFHETDTSHPNSSVYMCVPAVKHTLVRITGAASQTIANRGKESMWLSEVKWDLP